MESTNESAKAGFCNANTEITDAAVETQVWLPVTKEEILCFLGILIYMSLFPVARVSYYWGHDPIYPQYGLSEVITLARYKQIKLYFCVSEFSRTMRADETSAQEKLEKFSQHFLNVCKELYVPESNVSVNDIAIRPIRGRTLDFISDPDKKYTHSYQITTLMAQGFTYAWIFGGYDCPIRKKSRQPDYMFTKAPSNINAVGQLVKPSTKKASLHALHE